VPYPLAVPSGGGANIFPVGSGNPDPAYAGIFIPEIWSGKLLEKFYATTVLAAISNTDYEGEIRNQGDKINIRTRPTVTIRDYAANQNLLVERPSSNLVTLTIDKGKYFNTILDDVMDVQSDLNLMSLWSDDASEQMKLVIDTEVLAGLVGDAHADNRGTTAGKISSTVNLGATTTPLTVVARNATGGDVDVVDLLVRMGLVLDEQNVPENGRWVVLPAWMAALVKQSELRDASLTGDGSSILRNGRLGMVDRFTIYSSNLLPNGVAGGLAAGEWAVFAGTNNALTFASQLTKVETLRSESTFGTLLRGLQVYGSKVLGPESLVEAIVTP
jgi:hypothetical protein